MTCHRQFYDIDIIAQKRSCRSLQGHHCVIGYVKQATNTDDKNDLF